MTDRPISFVAPMIRALWDGWKTQTRRVIVPQPVPVGGPFYRPHPYNSPREWHSISAMGMIANIQKLAYAPGDRLWVREDWKVSHALDDCKPRDLLEGGPGVLYMATDGDGGSIYGRRRWSNHMPRWASRMTLTVTDVRVQRVQEISADDARDEGVDRKSRKVRQFNLIGADQDERARQYLNACKWEFEDLWDSLNKERGHGWDVNPWVAAYTFTVEKRNIDA